MSSNRVKFVLSGYMAIIKKQENTVVKSKKYKRGNQLRYRVNISIVSFKFDHF